MTGDREGGLPGGIYENQRTFMPKGILESQVGMGSDASILLLTAQISFITSFLGIRRTCVQTLPAMGKPLCSLPYLGRKE